MRAGIMSLLLAIILALIPCLSVLAQNTGTITITMTGVSEIAIELSQTEWPIGNVASNTTYETSPPIDWCTLTNTGNVNVNTFIVGEDASWTGGTYKWTLSSDGNNGDHIYVLWFRVHGDLDRGHVPITKTEREFWPYAGGSGSTLAPGDNKQFGLKLLTPTFFNAKEMQTHITISAVAA